MSHRFREGATCMCAAQGLNRGALSKPVAHSASLALAWDHAIENGICFPFRLKTRKGIDAGKIQVLLYVRLRVGDHYNIKRDGRAYLEPSFSVGGELSFYEKKGFIHVMLFFSRMKSCLSPCRWWLGTVIMMRRSHRRASLSTNCFPCSRRSFCWHIPIMDAKER